MKAVLMFSGQGSQYQGMCLDLYEKYEPRYLTVEYYKNIDGLIKSLKEVREFVNGL